MGIIVFGANGAGKTTLGRELARILSFRHMDIEDYAFDQSEIPYTCPRPRGDCINLMLADIEKHGPFVISSCTGDFGEKITSMYDLAVYVTAPKELRMKRIEQRGYDQFGERVRQGGDMYEQELGFRAWAASRPLSRIDEWAQTLTCPVMRIDGTADWRVNAAMIAERFQREGAKQCTNS
jgi:deoxyadenosine/deoxycytidine kinase